MITEFDSCVIYVMKIKSTVTILNMILNCCTNVE